MKFSKSFAWVLAGSVAALSLSAPQPMAAEYFAGKTITVLVGLTPGSGPDLSARFNSIYVAKNSPAYKTDSKKKFGYTSRAMPKEVGEAKVAKIAKFTPKMIKFMTDFIARGEASRKPRKKRKK